jgi:cytochrome P450
MVWNEEVQRGKEAVTYLMNLQQKILDEYRSKHSSVELVKDLSVLGHIHRGAYRSDRERCADMLTFIIGGHDTTAFSLSFILIEVARNPAVSAKIQEELRRVVPESAEHITLQQLNELTYLDLVIKEGMRLWPVAAVGPMRVASRDVEYEGLTLPEGSTILIPFLQLFRGSTVKARRALSSLFSMT